MKDEPEEIIKAAISDVTGVDTEEIKLEDRFTEELHMGPAEISEFYDNLAVKGVDISKLVIEDIETVEDLLEEIDTFDLSD